MNSAQDTRCRVGCPIRRSRDQRSLASPPGFSQRATSFIASQCQGIHQMPFFALDPGLPLVAKDKPRKTAAHRAKPQGDPRDMIPGASPKGQTSRQLGATLAAPARRPRMKTLLGQPRTGHRLRRALSASVTSQLSLYPSINPRPASPDCRAARVQTVFSEPRSAASGGHAGRQSPRRPQPRCPRRGGAAGGSAAGGGAAGGGAVVEVNGIEPMTSCLQSRRSPN